MARNYADDERVCERKSFPISLENARRWRGITRMMNGYVSEKVFQFRWEMPADGAELRRLLTCMGGNTTTFRHRCDVK
jgi:hypothetical protein